MPSSIYAFDAYGTLFDVHSAMARHREACGTDGDRMSEIWRSKQLEYTWTLTLAGQYVDFWELTERALDFALARTSIDRSVKKRLLDAYFELGAFPDARTALQKLKHAGHRTAILSNGSPPMLKGAVAAAGVGNDLDAVLSVDSVRMYKPRQQVYALVTDHFKCAPRDVTFVSSNRWDVMGAMTFGFSAAWINRGRMPEEYGKADTILNDLSSLP